MSQFDTFKHKGLRKQLISKLSQKPGVGPDVITAMAGIPRHIFMDSAFLQFAYEDQAFPIGSGQTISQPYTVAVQTTLLDVKPLQKVLEIGTGSGYQTAVLNALKTKVFSIERQRALFKKAQAILPKLNSTAKLFYGDGYKGLPTFAPFDRILITCGAPEIPEMLFSQLKVGGIMVVPVGDGEVQVMHKIEKKGEDDFSHTAHGEFQFVPMLPNKQSS
ncbi:MAG: protein-L-isoaspartate(D-aspartate) O-methyltransferase [Cryomorphaceae bacterium]|nr:protein-L-isoaspartate(D-aspartate) O-methyltransferase [Flavobacteriales bacterium]